MAYRSGVKFVLQIGTGTGPVVWATVAGINSSSVSLNQEAIDVTSMASAGWREMLDSTGLRTCDVSGSGFANTGTQLTALLTAWKDGTLSTFRLLMGDEPTPDLTIEGNFRINSLEIGGELNAAVSISLALSSSGPVTIT